MGTLLSLATAFLLFFQGLGYKVYSNKCVSVGKTNDYLLNLVNFSTGLVVLLPFALIGKSFDITSFLYGLVNGVMFCFMLLLYNKALQKGNIAFVNFIMSLAMLLPLFGGAMLFDEKISVLQFAGLGILLVASYLVSYGNKLSEKKDAVGRTEEDKHSDKKRKAEMWIFAIIGSVLSGSVSLFIKFSYNAYPAMEQSQYLLASYTTSFVVMTILSALTTRGFSAAKEFVPNKWFFISGIFVGAVTVFGNIAFTFFSVMTDSAIFYPITGALPMLLSAIISPLLKEKLSKITVIGIVIGVIAIVLLNL